MSRPILVDVVGVVVHTVELDLDHPSWQWLAELPEHERQAALTEEAGTTDSALEQLLTPTTLDGAWREAVIGTAHIRIEPDRTEPDSAASRAVTEVNR